MIDKDDTPVPDMPMHFVRLPTSVGSTVTEMVAGPGYEPLAVPDAENPVPLKLVEVIDTVVGEAPDQEILSVILIEPRVDVKVEQELPAFDLIGLIDVLDTDTLAPLALHPPRVVLIDVVSLPPFAVEAPGTSGGLKVICPVRLVHFTVPLAAPWETALAKAVPPTDRLATSPRGTATAMNTDANFR